jgi:DNA-binding NtrC family response regulator
LGLATVYGIVKQNAGYIWVTSTPGKGTRFTICLPKAEGRISEQRRFQGVTDPQGTETILLVEDEEALREAIFSHLCSLGYTVLTAASGQEAVLLANKHRGTIHLLITDVVMPAMSGTDLCVILQRMRTDMQVIYMSGYTGHSTLRDGLNEVDAAFLQKPFSLCTLAERIRTTLNELERGRDSGAHG